MTARRVVITGLGPVSSIGIGKDNFLEGLKTEKKGVEKIDSFDPSALKSQIGGLIRDFKCSSYVPKNYRKSIKVMARDIELAVCGADQAVRDANLVTKGIDPENVEVNPTRLGVNIGAGLICADLNELVYGLSTATEDDGSFSLQKWGEAGMNNLTPLWLLKYLPNMLACHVTIIHDAQAPSNTITCGEASSQLAIIEAFRTISRDCADVCLCGGAESKMNPMSLIRQDIMGRLTHSNDNPETAVKPFDENRDGTAVAEGGAIVVLEELEHAKKRDTEIYGELIGAGASFGTKDFLEPEEDGKAIAIAIERALADAEVEAGEVDLVIAFASGTKQYDQAEAIAIQSVLGEVPVTSIKGQIGLAGAGAGALDVVTAMLAMSEGFIPATANCEKTDPNCPVNVVKTQEQKQINTVVTLNYAMSGGQTGAMVFKKYQG